MVFAPTESHRGDDEQKKSTRKQNFSRRRFDFFFLSPYCFLTGKNGFYVFGFLAYSVKSSSSLRMYMRGTLPASEKKRVGNVSKFYCCVVEHHGLSGESYRNDTTLSETDRLNCRATNTSSIPGITLDADSVNGKRYFP